MIVICAWCGKAKSRKPNLGYPPVVSHGICVECKAKYFSELGKTVALEESHNGLEGVSLWGVR